MKKGSKKPEQKIVRYLGETWKLHPGHSVYYIDLNYDPFVVEESELKRVWNLFFWKEKIYTPKDQRENILHITAKDLFAAKVKFKHMTSDLRNKHGQKIKIKGL